MIHFGGQERKWRGLRAEKVARSEIA